MRANILLKRNNDFCNTLTEKWENTKISIDGNGNEPQKSAILALADGES